MQIPILVGIMSTLLASDEVVKASELAQKYEISQRSVYRYVSMLSEGGIPIQSHLGRGGGWSIVDTFKLKATYFTEEEFKRLVFALQSFSLQDDVTQQATLKLSGLKRSHAQATVLKSQQLIVDNGGDALNDYVSTLSDCIANKKLCKIGYHSKDGFDTTRVVEPYCLILKDGMWYVYSFCRMRKGFRYFKVARIVTLEVGEKFVGRPFVADSNTIQTDVLKNKEMCDVILSVDHIALSACEEWLGVGKVAKMGNGYIAKANLPYDDVLINKIMSLGEGVRVETPAKLREAVVERCKNIALANKSE